MRMCIDIGLHGKLIKRTSLIQQQLQRRIFWTCYIIDRYSSIILDRPFAIADRDIHTAPPVEADDDQVVELEGYDIDLDSAFTQGPIRANAMSVFCFCIRLRQLSSKMGTMFSRADPQNSPKNGFQDSLVATG